MIIVTTHEKPDADALTSAAAFVFAFPDEEVEIRFDSAPKAYWDNHGEGRFVVDVGRGPLDHHQLDDPRSTCAFALVCAYLAQTNPDMELLLQSCGPAVLRQDTTGRIDAPTASVPGTALTFDYHLADPPSSLSVVSVRMPRDNVANSIGLPALISAYQRERHTDEEVWSAFSPLILAWFASSVEQQRAISDPSAVLARVDIVWTTRSGRVVAYEDRSGLAPYASTAIAAAYPDADLIIGVQRTPDTFYRGMVARRGSDINVKAALSDALPFLTSFQSFGNDFADEIEGWYKERFFCGAGSMKFPRQDTPPVGLAGVLVTALERAGW